MDDKGLSSDQVLGKLQRANKMMEDLIDLATADEEITEEEKELLFCINDYLQEYVRIIIVSISDNIITQDEENKLKEIEKNIITDAEKIAMKDSKLSDDERNLLNSLVEAIEELSQR